MEGQVARRIILQSIRQEHLETQFQQGEFEIVSPAGVIIHPHVWPTGLGPGTEVHLLIGNGNRDEGEADEQREERPRQREQDARQREQDARQREQDARQRELDASQREQNALGMDRDLQQRERHVEERERNVEQRERDAAHGGAGGGARRPWADRNHTQASRMDSTQIRKYRACLSFFAGKTRIGDCGN